MSEYNIPNNVNEMSDLDKLLEATRVTNEVFIERGHPSGSVAVVQFLMTGNQLSFTSTNGARLLASTINYQQALLEVQTRLLRVATELASVGTELTDNEIINIILKKADIDKDSPIYSQPEIRAFINEVIQRFFRNSDTLTNALLGRVQILKEVPDVSSLDKNVKLLEDYANLIDPNIEERVVFRSGR